MHLVFKVKSKLHAYANRSAFHRGLIYLGGVLAILCLLFQGLRLVLWLSPKPELFPWHTWSTAYLDKHQKLLRLTLADDDKYRLYTQLNNVSDTLINATLKYEDQDFYEHSGIEFTAIANAFWTTYVQQGRQVGGSTISMQLARMAFDIPSSRIPGKLQQMLYALWIEVHYSKAEILSLYLNTLPYGGNIEGVEAASRIYFDKPAKDLNWSEALALAVIPQNPSKRNPVTTSGKSHLLKARLNLLKRWPELNASSWVDLPMEFRSLKALPFKAPHFVNYLSTNTTQLATQQTVKQTGLIQTTLDLNLQNQLEHQIKHYIEQNIGLGIQNATALLLNHQTMEVEAWLGSADFFDDSIEGQVDGIAAKRSPGSTLKPFIYALAMNQGLIHPLSILKDTPSRFAAYTPENYDLAYAGPISATEALITSRNVPALRLAARLKSPDLYSMLEQSGISAMKSKEHYGLSLALGGMEVSMLELVRLYAMLANHGQWQKEVTIQSLKPTTKDKPINHKKSVPVKQELISPESSWLTHHMLQQNPPAGQTTRFSGYSQASKRHPIAWKTGTSFAFRDAWAVGYDDQYVLAIWVGNFNGQGNPNFIGRNAAGPLFFQTFYAIQRLSPQGSVSNVNHQRPENLRKVALCKATGDLPGRHCPTTEQGWFIPGVSPIKTDTVFRQVPINPKTGKRACHHEPGKTQLVTYEFWPSDLLALYEMAGIQRKQPPAFEEDCNNQSLSPSSMPPEIETPVKNLAYHISEKQSELPLKATVDSDVNTLYWFIDGSFIGSNKAREPYFWKAIPGDFLLTVTDDKGLSDSIELSVRKVESLNTNF